MATVFINSKFSSLTDACYQNFLFALAWPPHDVNGEDAALMAGEQVINEVPDDGIRFVPELGHDSANERVASAVPLEVDRAVSVPRAVNFRPTVRPARLFGPDFDEGKFLFQFRIAHDLAAQRSAPGRDHLDDRLHSVVRFNRVVIFAIFLCARESR